MACRDAKLDVPLQAIASVDDLNFVVQDFFWSFELVIYFMLQSISIALNTQIQIGYLTQSVKNITK